jgi:hypothetical protein
VFLAFIVPAFIFLRHREALCGAAAGPARGPLLVGKKNDRRWRWPYCWEQTAACMLLLLGVVAAVRTRSRTAAGWGSVGNGHRAPPPDHQADYRAEESNNFIWQS